jgi:hypothetical protein
VLLGPVPAEAAAPTHQSIAISQTFPAPVLSDACGFAVTGHLEGTMTVTDFVDRQGSFVREITLFHLGQTFGANGHVITGRTSQQVTTAAQPDGSFTVAFVGTDSLFALPGSGPVIGSAGRLELHYSADGELVDVQAVGPVFADPAALCAALRSGERGP